MKKILISGLTLVLVLGLASVSMASTVYMDVWSGGEREASSYSKDLSQISIGLDMPIDDFKLACNLTSGTINDFIDRDLYHCDVDTASILLKGGYALINDRQLRLDITGGFYDRKIDWDYLYNDDIETESFYSLMLGFDAKLKLDKKAWIDFSYSFGLNPQVDIDYYSYSETEDLDSISLLNLKFNYLFTREFGASLGYNCETIDYENSSKEKYSGITVGAFFKF
jgi:hypothetical protein